MKLVFVNIDQPRGSAIVQIKHPTTAKFKHQSQSRVTEHLITEISLDQPHQGEHRKFQHITEHDEHPLEPEHTDYPTPAMNMQNAALPT